MRVLPVEKLEDPSLPAVIGLSLIRGEPCPVLDLGELFGSPEPAARWILVRTEGQERPRRVALAVTEVEGVSRMEASQLAELPPLVSVASRNALEAIAVRDAQLVSFLQTGVLLSDDAWANLEAL